MMEAGNQDMDRTVMSPTNNNEERTQMVAPQMGNATQYAASIECAVCHTPNPPTEVYCIDCGFMLSAQPVSEEDMPAPQSLGKLVNNDGTREYLLKMGENSVGRENADVLLADGTVSRHHAKITVSDGTAVVEDNGSTNGTSVAGKRLSAGEKVTLTDGCEVSFGTSVLKYATPEIVAEVKEETAESTEEEQPVELTQQVEAAPAVEDEQEQEETAPEVQEEVEEPQEAAPAEAGRLLSKDGSSSISLIAGVNTIGRREGANLIVIPDPYCSGRHADLTFENGRFILTDVGSTNGTMVNGVKVEANCPKEIVNGDEITFGQTVYKIEVA